MVDWIIFWLLNIDVNIVIEFVFLVVILFMFMEKIGMIVEGNMMIYVLGNIDMIIIWYGG